MGDTETSTMFDWQEAELLTLNWSERLRLQVEAAFSAYTGLEGLRDAYYTGVESRNCEGCIPNDYPRDDPKYRAFQAGYRLGVEIWGSDEP